MDHLTIRDFAFPDYEPLAEIHNALFPSHTSFLERSRYEDSCFGRTRHMMKRYVAEAETGKIVAMGEFKHLFFSYHPHKYAVSIEVHPAWQHQGVGDAMWKRLESDINALGAEAIWVLILSTANAGIQFAGKRGFTAKRRIIESKLKLGNLASKTIGVLEQGFVMTSLAEEMRHDSDAGRKLYSLENSASPDVPNVVEDNPMSYDDYDVVILQDPLRIWEGSFVVKHGDVYAASSTLLKSGIQGVIDQGFTAVRPEFRGRDLAQAVKFQVSRWAKSQGFKFIRTHNDSQNAPMLAVNGKLGFLRQHEFIELQKTL